ncbi:hypothetical protein LTR50_001449 [Elasticomyces elasticus]|nr:hypothetical protein LTR50_001449 [Elasticomyces elasticus]
MHIPPEMVQCDLGYSPGSHARERKPKTPKVSKPSFWATLCCMRGPLEDDDYEIVRHTKRVQQSDRSGRAARDSAPLPVASTPTLQHARQSWTPPDKSSRPLAVERHEQPARKHVVHRDGVDAEEWKGTSRIAARKPLADLPTRPQSRHADSSLSQTDRLLSLIPKHLSPQTTSALLGELAKPISPHDDAGYIYIFWLTGSDRAPSTGAASSLLGPPASGKSRRASSIMSEYSSTQRGDSGAARSTIMLKIGRANNVHRRMNEWTRQCGYNLSLVRWYPYVRSSMSASATPSPVRDTSMLPSVVADQVVHPNLSTDSKEYIRKVPHAHRVERLIHIELAGMRVKRSCETCGKEHREWFEVDANQASVKAVDEVIRRWIRWSESSGST